MGVPMISTNNTSNLTEFEQIRNEQRLLHLTGSEPPTAGPVELGTNVNVMHENFVDMFNSSDLPQDAVGKNAEFVPAFLQMSQLVQHLAAVQLSLKAAMVIATSGNNCRD